MSVRHLVRERRRAAQLRDLVEKGKTHKARWAVAGAPARAGRVVLDPQTTREQGAARFVADGD